MFRSEKKVLTSCLNVISSIDLSKAKNSFKSENGTFKIFSLISLLFDVDGMASIFFKMLS